MLNRELLKNNNAKLLMGFIGGWVLLNFLQSIFTGLYPDEAYYWVYSRQLQWGYFDHPPMVALLVKFGELMGHGSFYTRLGTILFSGGAVFFLFKALPREIVDTRVFVISFLSVIVFHVYGFVATPDAALFFFTALFFYAYRLYLANQNLKNTVFLTLSIVGLLYSKYHGILPVFFTFLSNPRLVFKPSAWLVVMLVVLLLFPHIFWQYGHDWPTIRYHLSERVASRYRISKTTNYILGQLVVWGPLTALPILYRLLKFKNQDTYIRAHQYTFFGVLLFFLLSSFKSTIEPHWTLVAGISFILLLQLLLFKSSPKFRRLFTKLAYINIGLAIILRLMLVLPGSPIAKSNNLKPLFYGKAWADSIYKYSNDIPVVFIDSYGSPALYQYYHPEVSTTSFNTINYRRNHYSISSDETYLNNRKVYLSTNSELDSADIFVSNPVTNTYLHVIDSFKAVNSFKIEWPKVLEKGTGSGQVKTVITLINKGAYTIEAGNGFYLTYTFFKTRKERITSDKLPLSEKSFGPAYKKDIEMVLKLPPKKGKYKLLFSIVSPPFDGTLASKFFTVEVE